MTFNTVSSVLVISFATYMDCDTTGWRLGSAGGYRIVFVLWNLNVPMPSIYE